MSDGDGMAGRRRSPFALLPGPEGTVLVLSHAGQLASDQTYKTWSPMDAIADAELEWLYTDLGGEA